MSLGPTFAYFTQTMAVSKVIRLPNGMYQGLVHYNNIFDSTRRQRAGLHSKLFGTGRADNKGLGAGDSHQQDENITPTEHKIEQVSSSATPGA
jgi:hypothetical protein